MKLLVQIAVFVITVGITDFACLNRNQNHSDVIVYMDTLDVLVN